ncbi:cytochrome c oxidase subunit II [uncultured Cocleimonas sp.]|uniref:cytochrome c oxidase subunit II n=1 Tax=uncultured Cocleimonas sp. TaxID=1051587 RepID=UPI00261536D2|nr:cytochrome c oxidase subunit II [uncultured Cocleimonas sp.]
MPSKSTFNDLSYFMKLTTIVNSFLNKIKNISNLYLLPLFFTPQLAFAEFGLNLTEGVTSVSRDIYGLHMLIFWVCVGIAVVVFGVMIWSMVFHRKSKGAKASNFHESTAIELVWTLVPLAILVAIAFPATRVLIDLENTDEADMTVKITGYQWKWQYEYIGQDVSFFSNLTDVQKKATNDSATREGMKHYLLEVDNHLVLPVGKRIRFLMTSNDVIHSWWVRDLGVKQDANPGFINDAWANIDEPGIYRGQCAELCGKDHGFMPIVVEAKSEADYQIWLGEQKEKQKALAAASGKEWSKEDLMAQGQKVYSTNCASCHGVTGGGIPGVFPAMTGSPITTGDVNAHIDIVLNGKAGTAMQAFGKQLSDSDLAAVITYERNALGNSVGDIVQPSSIKSAR